MAEDSQALVAPLVALLKSLNHNDIRRQALIGLLTITMKPEHAANLLDVSESTVRRAHRDVECGIITNIDEQHMTHQCFSEDDHNIAVEFFNHWMPVVSG